MESPDAGAPDSGATDSGSLSDAGGIDTLDTAAWTSSGHAGEGAVSDAGTSAHDFAFAYCVTGIADAGPGYTVISSFHANLTEGMTVLDAGVIEASCYNSASYTLQMAALRP